MHGAKTLNVFLAFAIIALALTLFAGFANAASWPCNSSGPCTDKCDWFSNPIKTNEGPHYVCANNKTNTACNIYGIKYQLRRNVGRGNCQIASIGASCNSQTPSSVVTHNVCTICAPSWTDWSACSATCGGGTQTRTDGCGHTESRACNTQSCCSQTNGGTEACDGTDNDCDGQTDENACFCMGTIASNAQLISPSEGLNVPFGQTLNLLVNVDTSRKCENICGAGFTRIGNACFANPILFEVDGNCGSNAAVFASSVSDWPSGDFCYAGSLGATPPFPSKGHDATWLCSGLNGGDNILCAAHRLTSNGTHYVCTGTQALNSTSCSGDEYDLSESRSWALVNSEANCSSRKCESFCNAGYIKSAGACVAVVTGVSVTSISNPGTAWRTAPFDINFTVDFGTSPRGTTQYRIDSNAWQGFGASLIVPIITDGNHSVDYNFCNTAGSCAAGRIYSALDATPPATPVLFDTSAYNGMPFQIVWAPSSDSASGILHYNIWWDYNYSPGIYARIGTATGTSFSVPVDFSHPNNNLGLHHIFVEAVNGAGLDANSNVISTTTDTTPPTAPVLSPLASIEDANIHLAWTPAVDSESGIDHYQVWAGHNSQAAVHVADTANTNYDFAASSGNGNYSFYVIAVNRIGIWSLSNTVSTTALMEAITAPRLAAIPAFNDGAFNLDWSANPGNDTNYGILRYAVWSEYNDGIYTIMATTTNVILSTAGRQALDGNYCYFVQMLGGSGRDANSNTVCSYMDSTAPVMVSIVNPGTAWQTVPFDINFVVDFGTSSRGATQYRIDSNAWQGFGASLIVPIITDGNHSVDYNFCNTAGSCAAGRIYSALDTTPPSAATISPLPAFSYGNTAISWTAGPAADPHSGIANYIVWRNADGNAWALAATTTNTTYTANLVADGNYGFFVQAFNRAGLDANSGAVYTAVSQGAPQVTVINPGAVWQSSDFNVEFIVNFGASGRGASQYRLDGGAWIGFGSALAVLISTDGNHLIDYNFCNAAGSCAAGRIYSALDTVPPVTTDDHVPGWHTSGQNITLAASDTNGSGVRATYYRSDGGAWSTYSGAFLVSGDGNHQIQYYSADNADNNEATHTIYVAISNNPPVVISIINANTWMARDFNLGFVVDYGSAGYGNAEYSLDGGAAWSALLADANTYYITITPSVIASDGNHAVDYNFTNSLGQSTAGTTNVLIDRSPPSAPVLAGLGPSSVSGITLSWTPSADPQSGIARYNVFMNSNGGAFAQIGFTAGTDYNYTLVGDANYGFFIEAVNGSGLDANSNTAYTSYDSTPPAIEITVPGFGWRNQDFNAHFDANYGASGFGSAQYDLDGAGWVPFNPSLDVLISTDLNHRIDYNFCDAAGNCAAGTAYAGLDKTAPLVAVTNPGAVWQNAAFNVSFDANFEVSGASMVAYRIDSGFWTGPSLPSWTVLYLDYNVLVDADGNHMIDYNFCDNANNCASGTIYSALDTVPPVTTDDHVPGWHNSDQNITLAASDANGSGVAQTFYRPGPFSTWGPYTYPFTITGDGNHEVQYYSVDNAGNIEATHTIYVLIDSSSPVMVQITNPGQEWANYDYNVSFDVNYGASGFGAAQYNLDGNGWSAFGADTSIFIGTDMNHQIDYNFCNAAGTCASGTVFSGHDSTAPVVAVINPGVGWTNSDYNVSFLVDFTVSGFGGAQYDLNGAGWTGFVSDYNAPISIDGNAQLDYNFCDRAGNCATGTTFAAIDRTVPSVDSITNPGTTWQTSDYNVSFGVTFGPSGRGASQYSINGGAWTDFNASLDAPISVDGNNSLGYSFCNAAGNCVSGSLFALHDASAPAAPVLSALPLAVANSVDLNWAAATDAHSGITGYAVWRDFNGALAAIATTTGLSYSDTNMAADGNYSYFVQAFNGAGLDSNSLARTTYRDGTGPTITSVTPLDDADTNVLAPTITASYYDYGGINTGAVQLFLDGSPVAPQSITQSGLSYTPSSNLSLGNHDLNVKVADFAGNSSSYAWNFFVTDGAKHNLALAAYNAPTHIDINGTALIQATVHNDGNALENSTIRFFVDGTQVYSSAIALGAGASQAYSYAWAPSAPGTFTIMAGIDAVALETTTADNNASSSITVDSNSMALTVDLVVSGLAVSSLFPAEGDIVLVTATVQNHSAAAFSGDVNVGFYDHDGLYQRTLLDLNLASLATQDVNFSWNTTGKLGSYAITATVDDTLDVNEANEANNSASRYVLVNGASPVTTYDLQTTYITAPASVYDGNVISVLATVRALGASYAGVRIGLQVDGADTNYATVDLANGIDQNIQLNWLATGTGSHTLTITADSLHIFDENSEANNSLSSTISVLSTTSSGSDTGTSTGGSVGGPGVYNYFYPDSNAPGTENGEEVPSEGGSNPEDNNKPAVPGTGSDLNAGTGETPAPEAPTGLFGLLSTPAGMLGLAGLIAIILIALLALFLTQTAAGQAARARMMGAMGGKGANKKNKK